jgi:segregation and condensation protein B
MEQEPKISTQGEEAAGAPATPGEREIARAASALESLLLVSAQPLPLERIGQLLGGLSKQEARAVVDAVQRKYSSDLSGILVEEVARGFQMRTSPANQEFVRKLFDSRPARFTRPSLETLAVVAYKQPVTRLEIEQIRGVDCAGALKTLMERRLVRVVGKKDVPGRPFLFGTTREFLEVFSLASLAELPSMRDIEEFLSAKSGTPAPGPSSGPEFFAGFGEQGGGGKELAAGLTETEHGDLFVSAVSELPQGISDDVLVEAASSTGADTNEMKPLAPAGKGFSKFAQTSEHFSSDHAEPLVTSSGDVQDWTEDEGPEQPED